MKVVPNATITNTGFTRASVAMYTNVSGVLTSAAINAIRLNYHPTTHEPLGMLLEQAATNLLTYSEQMDNAAYAATAATVTANATTAPDGAATADKLVEGGTNTAHFFKCTAGVAVTAYKAYNLSFYVKAAGRTKFQLALTDSTETNGIVYQFDLTAVSVSAPTILGIAMQYNAAITDCSSGWYRCSVSVIVDTFSTLVNFKLHLMNGALTTYAGDSASGLYLWGMQLESGTAASSYIQTVAASATRAADVLTSGTFGSSTVAEPDASAGEVAWNPATNYAVGVECVLVSTHRKYIRTIAGTTATSPHLDATNWTDNGATNRWAIMDLNSNQKTVTTGPLVMVVAPGRRIDSIALVGLTANTVRIQVLVGGVSYYDKTVTTLLRNTLTWTQYLTGAFKYSPSVVQFDIPLITNATVIITLTGGTVQCAGLIMGTGIYLGRAQYSATNSALNFSKVDRDAFGNATLVARRSIPKIDVKTELPRANVNSVRAARTDLNAVVALWSGLDDLTDEDYFEALFLVGIYKEFTISIDYVDQASVTLQVEEI